MNYFLLPQDIFFVVSFNFFLHSFHIVDEQNNEIKNSKFRLTLHKIAHDVYLGRQRGRA